MPDLIEEYCVFFLGFTFFRIIIFKFWWKKPPFKSIYAVFGTLMILILIDQYFFPFSSVFVYLWNIDGPFNVIFNYLYSKLNMIITTFDMINKPIHAYFLFIVYTKQLKRYFFWLDNFPRLFILAIYIWFIFLLCIIIVWVVTG